MVAQVQELREDNITLQARLSAAEHANQHSQSRIQAQFFALVDATVGMEMGCREAADIARKHEEEISRLKRGLEPETFILQKSTPLQALWTPSLTTQSSSKSRGREGRAHC
jgi:hypothetical protein